MSSVRYRSGEGELIPIIVLIIINTVVYLAINIAAYSGASFITIGHLLGLSQATVVAQPWTILTSMFTHMDFMHLLANMITLYFYGSFLNRITGTRTFLWIYFGGGLLSALAVILLSHPMSYTIGASGAVFALGGALAVLVPMIKVFIFPIPVPMPLWVAIAIGFVLLAFIPGVSWQGHLGGLLFGLAAGWYLRRRLRVML